MTWLAEIAPYAAIVVKTLRLAAPVGAAILGVGLQADQFDRVSRQLELMKSLVGTLPEFEHVEHGRGATEPTGATDRLSPAQGQALRGFRALLFQQDEARAFGDLRRVQEPSGEFVWVCRDHYSVYDPGLPVLPN